MQGHPEFVTFRPPTALPIALDVEPCLASWDRADHPRQVRMRTYLTHMDALVAPTMTAAAAAGPIAIRLDVGLPDDQPLTSGGRDLDNYLYPVVQHLGPGRFDTAWATKSHGPSRVMVCVAEPAPGPPPGDSAWVFQQAVTEGSTSFAAWKSEFADQLVPVDLGDGPLIVHIAYRLSPARNWAALWKPTIDSLGRILGEGQRAFSPRDDRITTLAFHRTPDDTVGWNIGIGIWVGRSSYLS